MDKNDVIEFFDGIAPTWDAEMIPKDRIIGVILDNAGLKPGMHVLDVACGTGVMFPHYRMRGAASVTGIDISPEMAKIAAKKYADCDNVCVICGDVEEQEFKQKFDFIMVYNAFPHFPDADRLIRRLSSLLSEGGILTVAHSMSREQINEHHSGKAHHVSNGLISSDELSAVFAAYTDVTVNISDENMYQVTGIRHR